MKKFFFFLVVGFLAGWATLSAWDAAAQGQSMSSQQQAIVAEAWTLTPQWTATAGFSGLPLRNCEGLYCGKLAEMAIGTQVGVLVNDREGWALVHVPSLNLYGWVNTNNIFR